MWVIWWTTGRSVLCNLAVHGGLLNKWIITPGYKNLGHILVDTSALMEVRRVVINIDLEVLSCWKLLSVKLKVYSDIQLYINLHL